MTIEEAEKDVEKAIGELYGAFYRLRDAKGHKEEYAAITTLIRMLQEDRDALIRSYPPTWPTKGDKDHD